MSTAGNGFPPASVVDVNLESKEEPSQISSSGRNLPAFESWAEAWSYADKHISSLKLQVTVSSPNMAGGIIRKYVTYLVRSEPFGYVVRRRYSHFEWLRCILTERYPGMLVPPLPPKSVVGNMAAKSTIRRNSLRKEGERDYDQSRFVVSRMTQLGLFIEQLVNIPFLRSDTSVLAFLSVQNDSDWERAQTTTSKTTCFTEQTEGCILWRTIAANCAISGYADRVLQDLGKQLETLASLATLAVSSTKGLAERAIQHEGDVVEFHALLTAWKRTEEDLGNPEKVETVSHAANDLIDTATKLSAETEAWTRAATLHGEIVDRLLHQRALYFQQHVEVMKDVIKQRSAMWRAIVSKRRALGVQEAELARGDKQVSMLSFSSSESGKSLSDQVKLRREELDAAERLFAVLNGALFAMEIERFHRERKEFLDRMMGSFAVGFQEYGVQVQAVAHHLLSAICIDEGEAARDASRSIETLRSKHAQLLRSTSRDQMGSPNSVLSPGST